MRRIYQGSFKDGNGSVVSGGSITAYLAGTTTLSTIYSVSTGGSSVSGSAVTSSNDGHFYFYIDEADYPPTQLFKITLSKTGYETNTYDDISILTGVVSNVASVSWFGAVGDGVTDDTVAIQDAIDSVSSDGGGEVRLQGNTYLITDTLEVPAGVQLIGVGCGQYPAAAYLTSANFTATPKTRLLAGATFTASAPMVQVKTPNAALYTYHSVVLQGLMLDCANVASYGLKVISVKNSKFEDLLVYRPVLVGIVEDVLSIANAVTEGNNATQFNDWKNVQVWVGVSGTTIGWQQTGTNSHNVNQCTYTNCGVVCWHGDALQVINADSNTWLGFRTYTFGKGVGVRLYGSNDAAAPSAFARLNIFLNPVLAGASHSGTAQAGGASTITLAAGASADDEQYESRNIRITGGTGVGQRRNISSYVGATKVATISAAWTTIPDATSTYSVYTGGVVAETGTTTASQDNAMYGYHTSDGASEPIINALCRFTYTMAGGASYAWRDFTPTVTFATPGNLSVSYATARGNYWRDGQTIKFVMELTFTPTFTTASGELRISLPPCTPLATSYGSQFYPCTVHNSDTRINWGAGATMLTGRIGGGVAYLRLISLGSATVANVIDASEMTSGQPTTLYIAGEYQAGA